MPGFLSSWTGVPLRLNTPMAMGGGQTRGQVGVEGLRARSLRGLLRRWTRFLLADCCDDATIRSVERCLYGGVHPSAEPSRLAVLIPPPNPLPGGGWAHATLGRNYDWTTVRGGITQRWVKGTAYLGALSFRETQQAEQRFLVNAGTSFRVRLRYRPEAGDSGALTERGEALAWASLWCLVHLGGAGSRANRGFGSLAVDPERMIAEQPLELPWDLGPLPGDCQHGLRQGLDAIRTWRDNLWQPGRGEVSRSIESLERCHIWVLAGVAGGLVGTLGQDGVAGGATGWLDLLDLLGDGLVAYRHHREPDTTTTMLARAGGVLERTVWGLPLATPAGDVLLPAGGSQRWPSPISFRVHRLAGRPGTDGAASGLVVVAHDLDPPDASAGAGPLYPARVGGAGPPGPVIRLAQQFFAAAAQAGAPLANGAEKQPWQMLDAWP